MFAMAMVIVVFAVLQKRKTAERDNQHDLEIKKKELEVLKIHIETQESEREKIARNIHDDIGPLITALKFHLTRFEMLFNKGELTQQHLIDEREFVNLILRNLRSTSQDLSPQFLLKNGLTSAFSSFMFELADVEVQFDQEIDSSVQIPIEVEVNAYRVLLEVVNNILKHDPPTIIQVEIVITTNELKCTIQHNGNGISNEDFAKYAENSNGIGMSSIKSRTTMLNATLDFQLAELPKIIFCIPLNHDENDQSWDS